MWAPFWWLVRRGSVKSCNKQLESDNVGAGSWDPDRRSIYADFSFLVNRNISMTKKTHKNGLIGVCCSIFWWHEVGWWDGLYCCWLGGWMTRVCDLCGCCRFHTPHFKAAICSRYVWFFVVVCIWKISGKTYRMPPILLLRLWHIKVSRVEWCFGIRSVSLLTPTRIG